jgi:signal transduction histidine kinase
MGAGLALRSLVGRTPDLEKVRTILEQIVNAGSHASETLDSVRASFKKSTQKTDEIDINKLILMVLNLTQFGLQGHGIEVRTQLSPWLPSVVGDAVQLQQVLLNLVMNAIEAIQGSTFRVLTVKSEFLSTDVYVSIEDTGKGIDADNLKRVFEPMFTTKDSGMGMGLAICRSIVESHRGRIWVSAGAERGSTFELAIPTGNDRQEIQRAS